MIDDEDNI